MTTIQKIQDEIREMKTLIDRLQNEVIPEIKGETGNIDSLLQACNVKIDAIHNKLIDTLSHDPSVPSGDFGALEALRNQVADLQEDNLAQKHIDNTRIDTKITIHRVPARKEPAVAPKEPEPVQDKTLKNAFQRFCSRVSAALAPSQDNSNKFS